MEIKISEIIGMAGFILAMSTFILTRFERRKKIVIDIYCLDQYEFENSEFSSDKETRLIVIDIINDGNRSITLKPDTIEIVLDNKRINHQVDWLGKLELKNPLNPGTNHRFAVFLASVESFLDIDPMSYHKHPITALIKDIKGKTFKNRKKYNLIPHVSEIEKNE